MNECQIVLIEDNSLDVYLVQMALKETDVPCEMTVFQNGEEAVRALCPPADSQQNSLVPDAILLDLNTPKSDGFEVLIRLKRSPRLSKVPIAILTSSQASSDKHRADIENVRYIRKPSQLADFLDTVGHAVKEMLHG